MNSILAIINRKNLKEVLNILKFSIDTRLVVEYQDKLLINIQYITLPDNDLIFKISPIEAEKICIENNIKCKIIDNELFYEMSGDGSRIGRNGVSFKNYKKTIRCNAE